MRLSLMCEEVVVTEFSLEGLEKADLNKLYRLVSRYGRYCKLGFNTSIEDKVVNRGYLGLT